VQSVESTALDGRTITPSWFSLMFSLSLLQSLAGHTLESVLLISIFQSLLEWFLIFNLQEANDANVASYIQQNYIPVPFIAMLIVQFILILVDRLLYRRGWELGKLIMLIGVVIVVHIWVFLGLPLATRRYVT
jgi:hypothetical protein